MHQCYAQLGMGFPMEARIQKLLPLPRTHCQFTSQDKPLHFRPHRSSHQSAFHLLFLSRVECCWQKGSVKMLGWGFQSPVYQLNSRRRFSSPYPKFTVYAVQLETMVGDLAALGIVVLVVETVVGTDGLSLLLLQKKGVLMQWGRDKLI